MKDLNYENFFENDYQELYTSVTTKYWKTDICNHTRN
jgi:hypothetical protein